MKALSAGLPGISLNSLTSFPLINAIYDEWNSLLSESVCNRGFSSPAWFLAACEAQPELTPCVLTIRCNRKLIGILPLAIRNATAEFPSAMSNYNDMITSCNDASYNDRVACELLRYAVSPEQAYSRVDLRWIRSSSNLARALRALPELRECFQSDREYSFIALSEPYEHYLASKSRIFRKGLVRYSRKASNSGIRVQEISPRELLSADLPDIFLRLHLARFGEESAFHKQPWNERMIRLALPALFIDGNIRVFALIRGSEIIAIDICMAGSDSLCTWNGGYTPEVECWSPGRLLIDAGIRAAYASGLKEYDLLRGLQPWKAAWANRTRSVGRIIIPVK